MSKADLGQLDDIIDDAVLKQQRAAFNTKAAARPLALPMQAPGERFKR